MKKFKVYRFTYQDKSLMNSPRHFLSAVISTLMWGFFSIPLRNLKQYPSEQILYYRIFTSLFIVTMICLFFRRKSLREDKAFITGLSQPDRRKLFLRIIAVSLLVTCNWFSFIIVVNRVSLQAAAFAYMVCPIITALSAYLILKEHLSRLKFAAIGIAFVSVAMLAAGFYRDVMWSVFVASLYAFYLIIQKKIEGINKFNFLAVQLIISSVIILPFFIRNLQAAPVELSFWLNITIISVFFTIIPLFLSLYALTKMPSSTMGIIIYLNPIVSFSVAFFYFREQSTIQQLFAYSLLLVAVVVFNWRVLKRFAAKKMLKNGGEKEEEIVAEIIP